MQNSIFEDKAFLKINVKFICLEEIKSLSLITDFQVLTSNSIGNTVFESGSSYGR